MTGQDYKSILENKYDKAYSSYFSDTQLNRMIKEALYRTVDKIYSVNDSRKEADELYSFIIKNEEVEITAADRVNVDELSETYYHLLRMAFTFRTPITFTYAAGVYTSVGHNLRKGDIVTVTGATDAAHNKDYTVTKVFGDKFYFDLAYVDGDISLVQTSEASPKSSDNKKSIFHAGTVNSPKYEATYDVGYFTPKSFILDPTPYSILVDYVLAPPVTIDVADTSTDLEKTYSYKFLMRVADEVVMVVGESTRDTTEMQIAARSVIDNP